MNVLDVELKPEAEWVADSKRRACAVCDRKFSTFVRKHHCRACGEVICKNCSSKRRVRVSSPPNSSNIPRTSRQPAGTAPASSNDASLPSTSKSSRIARLCIDCISPVLVDSVNSMLRHRPPPPSQSASLAQSSESTDVDYNEFNRVNVLRSYYVLDTPPSQEFDAICSAAAKTFDCAVAAISFLDATRQWYKASMGIQPSEVPRDVALCSHLLERPFFSPLVVLDTRADCRFRNNPLVTGAANVRFYASVPIVNSDGFVLGSIFVLDCKPRFVTVETRCTDILLHLAEKVMDLLEEHRARELSRLTVIEEASNEPHSISGGSSQQSSVPRHYNDDGVPLLNTGTTARTVQERADQDLLLYRTGDCGDGLATPPDSAPTMEPWSMTSSSRRAAVKAKGIEIDTTSCRDKLLHFGSAGGTGSGAGLKSEAESACLDLLCRVTDTQQMLAQQQTFIFERLSLHTSRMDRLESSIRKLEAAFHDLALQFPPPSQSSQPSSSKSEFITI
ncbi:hypothetical protein H310_01946 [Aphanomyces invadans]|uniref:FYVE-type domain-containing protein n=1 Tax=Aphanomyces invadans TaxID=157072 RepID=A0A024UPA6_9STRA|nr:hypothetical protein H310_01946 [Aphanomyces invadans]ETW07428.1 hypothetical protein H310_01946 [Aphanomyces invadans]|eukprot:XP_008863521.1 hypothetical protein H310_01946 [Aphanomyces invadans]